MSDPNVIREEVDEIVGSIKGIVDMAIAVGRGEVDKMALALFVGGQLPTLFMNGVEFAKASQDEMVDYGLEAFDALTGTDQHSLLETLPFLSPERTEQMFDIAKEGMREVYAAKFSGEEE